MRTPGTQWSRLSSQVSIGSTESALVIAKSHQECLSCTRIHLLSRVCTRRGRFYSVKEGHRTCHPVQTASMMRGPSYLSMANVKMACRVDRLVCLQAVGVKIIIQACPILCFPTTRSAKYTPRDETKPRPRNDMATVHPQAHRQRSIRITNCASAMNL